MRVITDGAARFVVEKLAWFLALWCAGAAGLALAAFVIRSAMRAAGLNS